MVRQAKVESLMQACDTSLISQKLDRAILISSANPDLGRTSRERREISVLLAENSDPIEDFRERGLRHKIGHRPSQASNPRLGGTARAPSSALPPGPGDFHALFD
jgi:hypothetical protein